MSNDEEDSWASAAIAADPLFSALEASGAPVLAARADPYRVVRVNAAAREIFGEPGTIRRLFDHAWPEGVQTDACAVSERESGEEDAGPRLLRTQLECGGESRRVTVLARKLRDETGARLFVLTAPGLRSAGVDEPSPAAKPRSRHGARPAESSIRFLWKTDAQDRFIAIDAALAEVVGAAAGKLVGASVEQLASRLGGGDALTQAIASRRSWSGIRVEWPFADGSGVAPVTLGALPVAGGQHPFAGYNGYGLIHLSQIRASAPLSVNPSVIESPSGRVDNVVPLRPVLAAIPHPESSTPAKIADADHGKLTETELTAFAEIARTLGEDDAASRQPPDAHAMSRVTNEHAEESRSTETLTTALDRLPIGILVARGAQTLFVNRSLLAELGYADATAFADDGGLARVFLSRSSIAASAAFNDIDAHVDTIDWDGAPATMISLIRAPLDRRSPDNAEFELKLARARSDNAMLRAVIDALDGAVAILDESGRIESATTAFSALFGAEKGVFDGQALSSMISPDHAPELLARVQRTEIGNPQSFSFTPRRATQPLEAMISRLPVGAGKICLVLRTPAAASIPQQDAMRQASERADAAKSGFLARISHEIRTPLNAIIGFAEVMIDERFGPVGSPRYRDYLKDIHASGTHVLSLVNDLLDLSKIEAGKMDLSFAPVDANAVIAECMSIMQPLASSKRVVLRQALEPSLPAIWADIRALRQILLNLLSNAVKFTPAGGQVIVSSAHKEANYVLLRVKDTGVGMSEEEVRRALESFTQIASASDMRGTGLGLPLTKALVEASRGSFTILSCQHEGTLIEIALPLTEVRAAG